MRCFEDPNITHVEGTVDPIRDIETIDLELIMADLQTVENRLDKVSRKAQAGKDKDAKAEVAVLERLKPHLEAGKLARSLEFNDDELALVRQYNLLTMKPVIFVANMDEDGVSDPDSSALYQKVKALAEERGSEVVAINAQMEEELSGLDREEKQAFLDELGLPASGLDTLIQTAYRVLGLCTFLTAGEDECRAWTFHAGMKAPDCAGVIHSDFKRGFIRAEVYRFEDMDELESEQAIKEAGRLRLEGKDYVVQDGDVVHFRFNV